MRCLLFTIAVLTPLSARGSGVVELTGGPVAMDLAGKAHYLIDAVHTRSIHDIIAPDTEKEFRPVDGPAHNFGYTTAACWLRFTLQNNAGHDGTWYIDIPYCLIDDIRLYQSSTKGTVERISGRLHPTAPKDIDRRTNSFAVSLAAGERKTYHLRALSKDSLPLPVTIMSIDTMVSRDTRDMSLLGIYYGMIVVMVVFNLIIFLATGERKYLFSMLLLISMHLFFQLGINGLLSHWLGLDALWWTRTSIAFFVSIGIACAILMTMGFLNTGSELPVAHRVLQVILAWAIIEAALALFIDYYWAIQSAVIMAMVGGAFMFACGIWSLIHGNRAALFYMLSWPPIIFGGLIYGLKVWAFIPSNGITEYGYQVGSAVQAVLISVALADNINLMRKERFQAQRLMLEQERKARAVQEEFNLHLEKLVEDRTTALNETLDELRKKDLLLQEELNLAQDIQQGILPRIPLSHNGIRVTGYYNAMEKIGGDFYDVFPLKGGHLLMIISDVSGHGIPAAFVTAMAKITFHEASQTLKFPRDIFSHVNAQLLQSVKTQDYLTAFLVIISPSYEVLYANASHPCALVLRHASLEIEEWDTQGLFIGAINDKTHPYEEKQDFLDFGDRLLLYTDGLVEARNAAGEDFGLARIGSLLRDTARDNLEGARNRLVGAFEAFMADAEQKDDITFLLVEIDPCYRDLLSCRNRGLEHMYHNQYEQAIGEFTNALSIDQANHEIHYLLGKCLYREKNYRQALQHLESYLGCNPDDADALCILAASYFNVRQYDQAFDRASSACMIRQNFVHGLEVMAMALMRLGRPTEARTVCDQILRIDPNNMAAHSELQRLNETNGDTAKGLEKNTADDV